MEHKKGREKHVINHNTSRPVRQHHSSLSVSFLLRLLLLSVPDSVAHSTHFCFILVSPSLQCPSFYSSSVHPSFSRSIPLALIPFFSFTPHHYLPSFLWWCGCPTSSLCPWQLWLNVLLLLGEIKILRNILLAFYKQKYHFKTASYIDYWFWVCMSVKVETGWLAIRCFSDVISQMNGYNLCS